MALAAGLYTSDTTSWAFFPRRALGPGGDLDRAPLDIYARLASFRSPVGDLGGDELASVFKDYGSVRCERLCRCTA